MRQTKISCTFKKHKFFLLFAVSIVMNIKKIFKEKEFTEILKTLGWSNDIEEY